MQCARAADATSYPSKPITILTDIPFPVVTNNAFPAQTLKEFIAYANANPAKVSFANAGMGTRAHLTQVMFMKAASISKAWRNLNCVRKCSRLARCPWGPHLLMPRHARAPIWPASVPSRNRSL